MTLHMKNPVAAEAATGFSKTSSRQADCPEYSPENPPPQAKPRAARPASNRRRLGWRPFHRLQRGAGQPEYVERVLAAHDAYQFPAGFVAVVGHSRQCNFFNSGICRCKPDIRVVMPDNSILEIDAAGRCWNGTGQ